MPSKPKICAEYLSHALTKLNNYFIVVANYCKEICRIHPEERNHEQRQR
jgi:hypothetical protein